MESRASSSAKQPGAAESDHASHKRSHFQWAELAAKASSWCHDHKTDWTWKHLNQKELSLTQNGLSVLLHTG
ncbi:MAG: hypothetical protein AAB664_00835, partial [Patescibacteria group bacterium]